MTRIIGSALVAAAMLSGAATAGAQVPAREKPMVQTISGYLERWDAGTYFLAPLDSRMASAPAMNMVRGAAGTSGTNAATRVQIVGQLPPGVSLLPFVGQKVQLAGTLVHRFEYSTPVFDMSWLPAGVEPVKPLATCLCE